ncbi:hypothetical protein DPMN_140027 [Dreissena polymorpha]|uniref:Uncharacterized protein n=1 Tax=Dreissena polymorpha TaxID=45954 RepID=A0A9D4G6U3_DREPO|nr:hypothetical protein DPMN_140027 [Dreissena polymorpha]
MILKSDNERHSYGPDKLIPPARQPASQPARQPASQPARQPARIRQSNNQFFPSENLVKNTHFGISRDYPREISEARKDLWPDFKAARDKYGMKNVKMLFPAALSVHGEVIRNLFPDWHSVFRGSRNSDVASRIDQRFKKIAADYAISVDTQQPIQSTEPQKNPNLFKRYNQPQTNRTQLSRNRRSEPKRHVAPKERHQKHPILAVGKRLSHPPDCHRNSPDT